MQINLEKFERTTVVVIFVAMGYFSWSHLGRNLFSWPRWEINPGAAYGETKGSDGLTYMTRPSQGEIDPLSYYEAADGEMYGSTLPRVDWFINRLLISLCVFGPLFWAGLAWKK